MIFDKISKLKCRNRKFRVKTAELHLFKILPVCYDVGVAIQWAKKYGLLQCPTASGTGGGADEITFRQINCGIQIVEK
jgi:hypothetical protein